MSYMSNYILIYSKENMVDKKYWESKYGMMINSRKRVSLKVLNYMNRKISKI